MKGSNLVVRQICTTRHQLPSTAACLHHGARLVVSVSSLAPRLASLRSFSQASRYIVGGLFRHSGLLPQRNASSHCAASGAETATFTALEVGEISRAEDHSLNRSESIIIVHSRYIYYVQCTRPLTTFLPQL